MLLELGVTRMKTWYGVGLLHTRNGRFLGLVGDVVEVAVALLLTGPTISSVWQIAPKHHEMLP